MNRSATENKNKTVTIDIPNLLIKISYIRLLIYQLTCSRPRAVSLLFMWDVLLFFFNFLLRLVYLVCYLHKLS